MLYGTSDCVRMRKRDLKQFDGCGEYCGFAHYTVDIDFPLQILLVIKIERVLDLRTARRFERSQAVLAAERVERAVAARALCLLASCPHTAHCERLDDERRAQN